MKALITGVNSLVNKALLSKLVEMGYEVTAHYHSDNDLTAEVKAEFPNVRFVQADFSDKESFLAFVKHSADAKYDVLVNAAVYYSEAKDWKAQQDWDAWEKTFAINTAVPGVLMAHGDSLMNKDSIIVNISSVFSQKNLSETQFAMYSASKAALDSLTMTYAKRWSPDIRVVGIAPGWVKSAWNKDMTDEQIKAMISPQLTHRLIEPEEIADLMQAIITNPGINATVVAIDGGLGAPIME
jgi:NAD(P)-dependent dehydrogenase (short-subunit alcohol dehydrogenase family)